MDILEFLLGRRCERGDVRRKRHVSQWILCAKSSFQKLSNCDGCFFYASGSFSLKPVKEILGKIMVISVLIRRERCFCTCCLVLTSISLQQRWFSKKGLEVFAQLLNQDKRFFPIS